jgi:hypothetical protein
MKFHESMDINSLLLCCRGRASHKGNGIIAKNDICLKQFDDDAVDFASFRVFLASIQHISYCVCVLFLCTQEEREQRASVSPSHHVILMILLNLKASLGTTRQRREKNKSQWQ